MAVTTGTIVSVSQAQTPAGPAKDSSGNQVMVAYIGFTISGTYAQSDNSQLLTVGALMRSSFARWGKAITILQAMAAAPGDEAGTPIGAKTVAVSGDTITFELTGGDLTTEHSNAAIGTINKPIFLAVYFTAPQT